MNDHETRLHLKAINRLWVRLTGLYGHTFTTQFGEQDGATFQVWAEALAGLTPQVIKAGLDACIASGDRFPPALPLFKSRCLLGDPSHKYFNKAELEYKPTQTEGVAASYIEKMAAELSGKKTVH